MAESRVVVKTDEQLAKEAEAAKKAEAEVVKEGDQGDGGQE